MTAAIQVRRLGDTSGVDGVLDGTYQYCLNMHTSVETSMVSDVKATVNRLIDRVKEQRENYNG